MKDEIKEILKYIDQFVYVDQTYNDMKLSKVDGKLLLDYITNLQEEIEKYKKYLKNRNKECNSLEAELYLYKDNNKYLNNKIDKANNILKDTSVDMPETLLIETIDYARHILNGGDDNER